jgi:hypothetical protein
VVKEAPKESVTAIQAQADRNIGKHKLKEME